MSEDERRNLPDLERENVPSGDDVEGHMLGEGSSERANIDVGTGERANIDVGTGERENIDLGT